MEGFFTSFSNGLNSQSLISVIISSSVELSQSKPCITKLSTFNLLGIQYLNVAYALFKLVALVLVLLRINKGNEEALSLLLCVEKINIVITLVLTILLTVLTP